MRGTELVSCVLLGILVKQGEAQNGRYKGHQIARITTTYRADVRFLKLMEKFGSLELWNEEHLGNSLTHLTVHLKPGALLWLELGLKAKIHTQDLEEIIMLEKLQARLSKESGADLFDRYLDFAEILDYLEDLAAVCGKRCLLFDIGETYEGRPIRVIKVTGVDMRAQKRGVWIDAGIHSREWISHATNLFLLTRLVEDYNSDAEVRFMADNYDWYFLPVINADGYEYTWTEDRLWRKSRRPNEGSSCIGTDINRNFDFMWMTIGASDDPCSNTFAGQYPYSEQEAGAVADFVLSKNGTWELFITLHSKGQLFMAPWGYTTDAPQNEENLRRAGEAAVEAILDTHGEVYEFGSASSILYPSSGTSRDWAAGGAHIPYVYTIELRDTGEHGWILPAENIRPTGEEIWAALKAVIRSIQESNT